MKLAIVALAGASLGFAQPEAIPGAHTWDVGEIFSNADGTIQFIELQNGTGTGETHLNGLSVSSAATGKSFTFGADLTGSTSNKRILLATAGFAALPGVPAPDHIIEDNFFSTAGDTITYHIYDCATFTLAPTGCVGGSSTLSALPTDGCQSLSRVGTGLVARANSPTNYAGTTGGIFLNLANLNGDNAVNVLDLLLMLGAWGPNPGHAADLNGDSTVNVLDLLLMLGNWGNCT